MYIVIITVCKYLSQYTFTLESNCNLKHGSREGAGRMSAGIGKAPGESL